MDRSKRHLLILRTLIPAAAVAVALSSCHRDPTFGVEGTIDGADDLAVTVEKSDYSGRWQPIDSTRTDSKGHFSMEIGAPSAPEIYRVGIGDGKWVYIPVDSTETITVSAPLKGFDTSFTLSGSDQAKKMGEFDKALIALGSNPSAERLEAFRRDVYTRYLQDSRGSVMSYYVLTKTIDGRPLFDPTDPTEAHAISSPWRMPSNSSSPTIPTRCCSNAPPSTPSAAGRAPRVSSVCLRLRR